MTLSHSTGNYYISMTLYSTNYNIIMTLWDSTDNYYISMTL